MNLKKNTSNALARQKNTRLVIGILCACFIGFILGISNAQSYLTLGLKKAAKLTLMGEPSTAIKGGYEDASSYLKGKISTPKKIQLDIKFKHFEKLKTKVAEARKKGLLVTAEDDYVPANLSYQSQSIPIKLRLKGDWLDHLIGDKWSFRIKTKGDHTFLGMKKFSIHHPRTRNYISEWLFQKASKKLGLISLRSDFIEVVVNGKNLGVYALEEAFEKRLLENNKRRAGLILKFDDHVQWNEVAARIAKGTFDFSTMNDPKSAAAVSSFSMGKKLLDPTQRAQFIKAHHLWEGWLTGKLEANETFDLNLLAKYYALINLFGANHAEEWVNHRYYYNPITALLEPITFDSMAGGKIDKIYGTKISHSANTPSPFRSLEFLKLYTKALKDISRPEFLSTFLEKNKPKYHEKMGAILKSYPEYRHDFSTLRTNQKTIAVITKPTEHTRSYLVNNKKESLVFKVKNITVFPIEVSQLHIDNQKIRLNSPYLIKPTSLRGEGFKDISIPIPKNAKVTDQSKISLVSNIIGIEDHLIDAVYPWPYLTSQSTSLQKMTRKPTYNKFSFIKQLGRKLFIKKGSWVVDTPLIVPPQHELHVSPGTQLKLTNSASIISYSPLIAMGKKSLPIVFYAESEVPGGIAIIKSDKPSKVENVNFLNLGVPKVGNLAFTGAITFFKSPVHFKNCTFKNNQSEDSLNLVESPYKISNSHFENTYSDALDADFSDGAISHTSFKETGNDSIDISGSSIKISNVSIESSGDKAISIGENSRANGQKIKIRDSNIAIAAKDLSRGEFNDVHIENTKIGFTAFRKKPEFGPAHLNVTNGKLQNISIDYLLEENSSLAVNHENKPVNSFTPLRDRFYPAS